MTSDQRPATSDQRPATSDELCVLISIIIPAYNCEKYIAKALDSLINQDYPTKNYEIIITDDGSTDETGSICDDYASRYPFVHVTHTPNMGAAHARNVGLPQCRGEYITFCDADDYVSPQYISVLTRAVEILERPDFIVFRHFVNDPADGWPVYDVKNMNASESVRYDNAELCGKMAEPDNKVGGFTFNKLIKRVVVNGYRFDESLIVCEDEHWLFTILTSSGLLRVFCMEYYLYCYVQRPNFGLTRNIKNTHDPDGMNRFVSYMLMEINSGKLSARAVSLLKGNVYRTCIAELWYRPAVMIGDVHSRLRNALKKCAVSYYFGAWHYPLRTKIKNFIKHILILLNVHK